MKTAELIGPTLNWAAKAHGGTEEIRVVSGSYIFWRGLSPVDFFAPTTDWSQGGPIIERERIGIEPVGNSQWHGVCGYTISTQKRTAWIDHAHRRNASLRA